MAPPGASPSPRLSELAALQKSSSAKQAALAEELKAQKGVHLLSEQTTRQLVDQERERRAAGEEDLRATVTDLQAQLAGALRAKLVWTASQAEAPRHEFYSQSGCSVQPSKVTEQRWSWPEDTDDEHGVGGKTQVKGVVC